MIRFEEANPFKKELKTLTKKYKSLLKDLEIFKKVLEKFPEGNSQKNFPLLNVTNNMFLTPKKRLPPKKEEKWKDSIKEFQKSKDS